MSRKLLFYDIPAAGEHFPIGKLFRLPGNISRSENYSGAGPGCLLPVLACLLPVLACLLPAWRPAAGPGLPAACLPGLLPILASLPGLLPILAACRTFLRAL